MLKKLFVKEASHVYRVFGIKISFKTKHLLAENRACRLVQDSLDMTGLQKSRKIILFLTPGRIKVNGGVMSIFSLCQASRTIMQDFFCCIATYPNDFTYVINDKFYNNERILRFEQIVKNANKVEEMILHIPEYYAGDFYNNLNKQDIDFLTSVPNLQINILNQNIELMPSPEKLQDLYNLTKNITQTLAHNKYATQEVCNKWKIPTHLFSVNIDISKYKKFTFEEKEKVIALSPDYNEHRKQIVEILKNELPDWEIVTINNLSFSQYMDLIGRSFFTITFGEGMDGYFNQPIYVGGLGMAVYNRNFFPDETWSELKNVYSSYAEMGKRICEDIKKLSSDKELYCKTIQKQLEKLNKIYTSGKYMSNIERFYKKEYDFMPVL